MGILSGIIGGVTSGIGGLIAGNSLSSAYAEQQRAFQQRIDAIKAHRDKVYYQDPSQSAEIQAAVAQSRNLLGNNAKRTAGVNAVIGGTDAAVAMEKKQGAEAVGDMMGKAAMAHEQNKEQVYQQSNQEIDQFEKYKADSKMAQAQQKASAITQAVSGLGSAIGNLPW